MNVNPWRRLGALLAALALAGALTPARAEVSESVAEQLMRDSGMWEQMADFGPQLKQGFEQSAANPPPDMGPDGAEGLRRLAALPADDRVDAVVHQGVAVEHRRVQGQHRGRDADAAQLVGGRVGHRDRGRVVGRDADHQGQRLAVLADPPPGHLRRRLLGRARRAGRRRGRHR